MAMEHYNLFRKSHRVFLFDSPRHYELAIEELTEYLKANPRDGIAYNNRGLAYSEMGQGEEALLDFAKAIECLPNDPAAYLNRADLYMRAEPAARLQEAIEDFTRAVAAGGTDATLHRRRAYACLRANRLQDAVDSFSEAIRLEPEFRQTYIDRGKAYQAMGEDRKAQQDFDAANNLR